MHETRVAAAARLRSTAELAAAEDPEALQRHLLGSSHDHAEFNGFHAVVAFKQAHRSAREGASMTALLLCTDPRWRRTTKPLIAAIVETGVLGVDALDELAGWFLEGEELWLNVPVSLIDPHHVGRDDATVALWRRVAPPLVGWAAAHATRRDGAQAVEVLLADLDHRSSAHAGAVLKGLVGVLDDVPAQVGARILERALQWPEAATRTAAIRHLHAHGHAGRAIRLARADTAKGTRQLADRLKGQLDLSGDPATPPAADPSADPPDAPADAPATSTPQPTLFP